MATANRTSISSRVPLMRRAALALSFAAVLGSFSAPVASALPFANTASVADTGSVVAASPMATAKAAKPAKAAKAAEPASKYAYKTYVANSGDQHQVDACTGGVTNMTAVTDYLTRVEGTSKLYLPIHNECGGRPILDLEVGEKVLIDGVGKYEVVALRNITRGAKASALAGLPGSILLQTCFDTGNQMRVVSLTKTA